MSSSFAELVRFLGGTGVGAFCLHLMYSLGSPVPKMGASTGCVGNKQILCSEDHRQGVSLVGVFFFFYVEQSKSTLA